MVVEIQCPTPAHLQIREEKVYSGSQLTEVSAHSQLGSTAAQRSVTDEKELMALLQEAESDQENGER